MEKRDTKKYVLEKNGKQVYVGITNDLERREAEHRNEGKDFDMIKQVGRTTTAKAAARWEEESISKYKDSHNGCLPKYNKNNSGK